MPEPVPASAGRGGNFGRGGITGGGDAAADFAFSGGASAAGASPGLRSRGGRRFSPPAESSAALRRRGGSFFSAVLAAAGCGAAAADFGAASGRAFGAGLADAGRAGDGLTGGAFAAGLAGGALATAGGFGRAGLAVGRGVAAAGTAGVGGTVSRRRFGRGRGAICGDGRGDRADGTNGVPTVSLPGGNGGSLNWPGPGLGSLAVSGTADASNRRSVIGSSGRSSCGKPRCGAEGSSSAEPRPNGNVRRGFAGVTMAGSTSSKPSTASIFGNMLAIVRSASLAYRRLVGVPLRPPVGDRAGPLSSDHRLRPNHGPGPRIADPEDRGPFPSPSPTTTSLMRGPQYGHLTIQPISTSRGPAGINRDWRLPPDRSRRDHRPLLSSVICATCRLPPSIFGLLGFDALSCRDAGFPPVVGSFRRVGISPTRLSCLLVIMPVSPERVPPARKTPGLPRRARARPTLQYRKSCQQGSAATAAASPGPW